jgi:glycosyltransferase involved in cell wall biosynthesis
MHILLITEFFTSLDNPVFTGGVEARTFYTANILSKNHKVTVISRRKVNEKKIEKKGNLTILRVGENVSSPHVSLSSILSRLIFILSSSFKALQLKPDLIECSNVTTFLPVYIIAKFKKIPALAWYPDTLKGNWRKHFGFLVGIIGEISESLFLSLNWHKIITISESVKNRLIKNGVKKENIEVIPCGVDLKYLQNIQAKKQNQLVTVSRLVKYKRVEWAIKAFKALNNQDPTLSLVIIGKGPEEKNIKKTINKYKLDTKITLVKNANNNDVYKIIKSSKLLLHPSLIEGFGIVLVEAAALNTPFVASDIPTSREIQTKLNSGLLFNKESLDDFIHKTNELLKSDKQRERFAQNGLMNVKDFNWENLVLKTQHIYLNSLSKL